MANATQFHWDEVVSYGDDKADRRVVAGKAGELKRVAVPAGYFAARHAHEFEQILWWLRGWGCCFVRMVRFCCGRGR